MCHVCVLPFPSIELAGGAVWAPCEVNIIKKVINQILIVPGAYREQLTREEEKQVLNIKRQNSCSCSGKRQLICVNEWTEFSLLLLFFFFFCLTGIG